LQLIRHFLVATTYAPLSIQCCRIGYQKVTILVAISSGCAVQNLSSLMIGSELMRAAPAQLRDFAARYAADLEIGSANHDRNVELVLERFRAWFCRRVKRKFRLASQLQAGGALLSARRTARSVKSSVCFEPSPKLSRSPIHSEISPAGFIRTCRAASARIRWRPYSAPARFRASVKPSVYRSKVSPSASFS